jgi:hypothetical protein
LIYLRAQEDDINIFGVETSIKESSCAFAIGELSLFKRLSIFLSRCDDPLA